MYDFNCQSKNFSFSLNSNVKKRFKPSCSSNCYASRSYCIILLHTFSCYKLLHWVFFIFSMKFIRNHNLMKRIFEHVYSKKILKVRQKLCSLLNCQHNIWRNERDKWFLRDTCEKWTDGFRHRYTIYLSVTACGSTKKLILKIFQRGQRIEKILINIW